MMRQRRWSPFTHTWGSPESSSAIRSCIRTLIVPANYGEHSQGLPGVSVYINDILVTGMTIEEHLSSLKAILTQLEESGIKLKQNKCSFLLLSVEYLVHRISANGVHPTPKEVEAVQKAPTPKDVSQCKSFLGVVNYCSKFVA